MQEQSSPLTLGVGHGGLTVPDLDASRCFSCECLKWRIVGENPSCPAVFISDGRTRATLRRAASPRDFVSFDRRCNVGLRHLACTRAPPCGPGMVVEFASEPSGSGPKIHSMTREPGGTRVEFAYDPR